MNKNEVFFEDIIIYTPEIFKDNRGHTLEIYNGNKQLFLPRFCQSNISFSHKNSLRGLHFQSGDSSQSKYLHVIEGEILDVVVDINICSSTYGMFQKIKLSKNMSIFIPHGFAHGFLAKKDSLIVYNFSSAYNKEQEKTLLWNDKDINIDWGIKDPILSEKDRNGIKLKDL